MLDSMVMSLMSLEHQGLHPFSNWRERELPMSPNDVLHDAAH